jgi:hypothetical protein
MWPVTDVHSEQKLPLGTLYEDKDGNVYRYVQNVKGSALATQYAALVESTEGTGKVVLAGDGTAIGVEFAGLQATSTSVADDYYFMALVATRSQASVPCTVGVSSAGKPLIVSSASPGKLTAAGTADEEKVVGVSLGAVAAGVATVKLYTDVP